MAADIRDNTRSEFLIKVEKVFSQILETPTLSHVVGKFVEVTKPVLAVLPIGEAKRLHETKLGRAWIGSIPPSAKNNRQVLECPFSNQKNKRQKTDDRPPPPPSAIRSERILAPLRGDEFERATRARDVQLIVSVY